MYSGLIISKSERCRAASGIPKLLVSFLMRTNQVFMRTQLTGIKMATSDFGSVTVTSCESALFLYPFGLFHGMQQTDP